jgi:hypothetical protein
MADNVVPIVKPSGFSLDKFKTKGGAAAASVETLQTALPHLKIKEAKDFVRLHPNEDEFWSPELCFVNVPIKGQKKDTLHLIDEELAVSYLVEGQIERFRLALATKPFDAFFFCHVPTRNLDNEWNSSNLLACEQAKVMWVQATSRKGDGVDGYQIRTARDSGAFPEPQWPSQSLSQLLEVTFNGRMIDHENHPGLLRLIGARQELG